MACDTRKPPTTPAPLADPQISALTLTPSLITEGDSVAVTASFTGGAAVLVVDDESQTLTSDIPVTLTLARKRGALFEERELLVTVTSPEGKVVEARRRLTIVPQVATPVLIAPFRVAQTTGPALAHVEPVEGMRYEWEITSGHFTSPATGTSVSFDAEGDGPVLLSVTALNPLDVRSAAATASILVQSIAPYPGLPPVNDAETIPGGDIAIAGSDGELYAFPAFAKLATKLDCYGLAVNSAVTGLFASAGKLYGADNCIFTDTPFGSLHRSTILRKDVTWARVSLCDERNTASEQTVSFVDLGDHFLYVVAHAGVYTLKSVPATCADNADHSIVLRQENGAMRLDEAPDGSLYLSSFVKHAIYRAIAGTFTLFAGGGDDTLAGTDDGVLLDARFKLPGRMSFDALGRMYVVDVQQAYEIPNSAGVLGSVRVIADGHVSTAATKPGDFPAWNDRVVHLFPSSPSDWLAIEPFSAYRRVDR